MRTVHETEALRPSDPIPKSMHPTNKALRLKLAAKLPHTSTEGLPPLNGIANGSDPPGWTSSYPPELGFTADEEARGPKELYRFLRRHILWAEEEGESLKKQCEVLEELRKKEWLEKEVLLDQVINNEANWHQRRQEVLAGMANLPSAEEIRAAAAASMSPGRGSASSPPVHISDPPVEENDAATVLASMHNA